MSHVDISPTTIPAKNTFTNKEEICNLLHIRDYSDRHAMVFTNIEWTRLSINTYKYNIKYSIFTFMSHKSKTQLLHITHNTYTHYYTILLLYNNAIYIFSAGCNTVQII